MIDVTLVCEDSNSKLFELVTVAGVDDEDIVGNFDGGEIDLMFSQNYGEDNNEDDQFMDNAGDFSDAVMTSDQY